MDNSPADRTPDLESDDETESATLPSDDNATDSAFEAEFEQADDASSRRGKLRKLLLGLSLGGLGLAVLAAVLRRALGGDDSEDDAEAAEIDDAETAPEQGTDGEAEPDTETPETDEEVESVSDLLTADAEGAAAMVGLGFNLLVRALVDDNEADLSDDEAHA